MWNDPIPVSSNSIQIQLTFAQRFLSLSDQTIGSALRNFYGVLLSFYAHSNFAFHRCILRGQKFGEIGRCKIQKAYVQLENLIANINKFEIFM